MTKRLPALPLAIAAVVAACGPEVEPCPPGPVVAEPDHEPPDGWSESTHGRDAEPAYDRVFADDRIHRIDIEFEPADWRELRARLPRMKKLEQELGEQFPAASAACEGRAHLDPCEVGEGAEVERGLCRGEDGRLACVPERLATSISGSLRPGKTYTPCEVRYDGHVWRHVGFRYKGRATFTGPYRRGSERLPFKLKFDEFEKRRPEVRNQRFFGFQKLTFANSFLDPTRLRDAIASHLFRGMDVPAPRVAFYLVRVNHGQGPRELGLYAMIEDPDGPLLETAFRPGGNLYEGRSWWDVFRPEQFLKRNNRRQEDWSDVERVFAALHADAEPQQWREGLEAVFDVDLFLRWWSVNLLCAIRDAYGIGSGHNYYVYSDPGDRGRLKWIPWDSEHAFSSEGPSALEEIDPRFPLLDRILGDSVYEERFLAHLRSLLAGPAAPSALLDRARKYHQLVRPHLEVPRAGGSSAGFLVDQAQFDRAFANMGDIIRERQRMLSADLAKGE